MLAAEQRQIVAKEIISQLGGGRFKVMTGAKMFSATEKGLSFRLPGGGGFCKSGINCVTIDLNSMDTYDVKFYRLRGMEMKLIHESNDVYNDSLQQVFEQNTGLRVSL